MQHSRTESGETTLLRLTSEDGKLTCTARLSHLSDPLFLSVVHAYDVTLNASRKREEELIEKLDAAQCDALERDQKCSKLEDVLYQMQKNMAASRDDYEQPQELLEKLQQKSKFSYYNLYMHACGCTVAIIFLHVLQ